MKYLGSAARETRFNEYLRVLEARKDADRVTLALFREMSSKIRIRIAAGCRVDDIMDAVDRAYPADRPTNLQELPDEQTPARRPSAADLRRQSESWLIRLFRW